MTADALTDVQWLTAPGGTPLFPQPRAQRYCGSCERSYLHNPVSRRDNFDVLAPSGTAHIGLADLTTACGRDAWRPGWWWSR